MTIRQLVVVVAVVVGLAFTGSYIVQLAGERAGWPDGVRFLMSVSVGAALGCGGGGRAL